VVGRVAGAAGEQAVSIRLKARTIIEKGRRINILISPFLRMYTIHKEEVPKIINKSR